jgi:hypothetical protein
MRHMFPHEILEMMISQKHEHQNNINIADSVRFSLKFFFDKLVVTLLSRQKCKFTDFSKLMCNVKLIIKTFLILTFSYRNLNYYC